MTDRMIELQRAKLGLPPIARTQAPSTTTATTNSLTATINRTIHQPTAASAAAASATPASFAPPAPAAAPPPPSLVSAQDGQLQTFLHRLQRRRQKDASTVPCTLSRRMLHQQGVGYLDETVANVVSAAGDVFLATVLQQGVACRDQRIKGKELQRQQQRRRGRHVQQYKADADDRKRRKLDREEERMRRNRAAVAAAEALRTGENVPPALAAAAGITKSKKKKKTDSTENGGSSARDFQDDDDLSMDSLDEEEEYYEQYYGEIDGMESDDEDDDEDEESRLMLLLRDLERPLEAWNVHLTGKAGLGPMPFEISQDEVKDQGGQPPTENGPLEEAEDGKPDDSASSQALPDSPGEKDPSAGAGGPSSSRPGTPAPSKSVAQKASS